MQKLDIHGSSITDTDWKYLDLPALDWLGVSDTRLSGEKLSQLSRFKDLKVLHANGILDVAKLIGKLNQCKMLNELSLAAAGLTNADMQVLGHQQLPNLAKLYIGDNAGITDDGLKELVPLNDLQLLDLQGCKIIPSSIATLRKFPKLKQLNIDLDTWSAEQQLELRRALPKCRIFMAKEQ